MKRGWILLLVLILLFPFISSSVDSEIKKITHYAEEYETGNIDYVKLLVYASSAREKLNQEFGVSGKDFGGILKQNQIQSILGEPNERTKGVWAEGPTEEEKRLIKQDEKFMNYIREISEKYNGQFDLSIQLKDFEKDKVIYNVYAKINEEEF